MGIRAVFTEQSVQLQGHQQYIDKQTARDHYSNLPSSRSVSCRVYVIPNALVPDQFTPSPISCQATRVRHPIPLFLSEAANANQVTIVVLSRLAYRKGIDLLIATAPRVCALFPNVKFIVGAFSGGSACTSSEDKREQATTAPSLLTSSKCANNISPKTELNCWDQFVILMSGTSVLTGPFFGLLLI